MGLKDKLDRILTEPYEPALNEYRSTVDAYVIVDVFDGVHQQGVRSFVHSYYSQYIFNEIYLYPATTIKTAEKDLDRITAIDDAGSIKWNWPLTPEDEKLDMLTGLTKECLVDHIPAALINQTMSHVRLWDVCIKKNEPIAILNSNMAVRRKIDMRYIQERGFNNGVVSLNCLNEETKNNQYLHDRLEEQFGARTQMPQMYPTPSLQFAEIGISKPQPFPGHGAYIITPWAARKAFDVIQQVGLWPVQFLFCRQLFPWTYIMWPQAVDSKKSLSPTQRLKK
tara:strand:+ start:140 stop:982 length:843 start_codon:yes stop_codon:yes gene_type:complete